MERDRYEAEIIRFLRGRRYIVSELAEIVRACVLVSLPPRDPPSHPPAAVPATEARVARVPAGSSIPPMPKGKRWKRAAAESRRQRRAEKRKDTANERAGRSPAGKAKEMSELELWCATTMQALLAGYARNRGMQPLLIALVPGADGTLRQMALQLDDTDGVEVLRSVAHPWPSAVATVFARGYQGDFLAIARFEGREKLKLIDCGGAGLLRFNEREPTTSDFEGPLPSDARELDGDDRRRAVELARKADRRRATGTCLYSDASGRCDKPAIASHSVGRAAHLRRIAEAGHVLAYSRDRLRYLLGDNERIARIGINEASTFRGFCTGHDHEVFTAIDRSPIEPTQRNAELLGYRALAYEFFVKEAAMRGFHEDLGLPPADQLGENCERVREPLRSMLLGWRDIQLEKAAWDDVIANPSSVSRVRFHFIRLEQAPEILGSAYVCPDLGFDNTALQDLSSPSPGECVAISIVQDGEAGMVAFAWLEGPRRVGEQLIGSLGRLPEASAMDALARWLFKNAENLYWSPSWWRSLPAAAQRELEHLMDAGVVPWVEPLNLARLVDWRASGETRGWVLSDGGAE